MTPDEWAGCYPSSWKGIITKESFSHPAKFSSRLIKRIYEHAIGHGWIQSGSTILDPFAGVALGAHFAMIHGMNWIGVEIEPEFVELGRANINKWEKEYAFWVEPGMAHIFQGDSRRLPAAFGELFADIVISSPPFQNSLHQGEGGMLTPHQDPKNGRDPKAPSVSARKYGDQIAQLGNMKEGDFDAVISSPPFLQSSGGSPEPKGGGPIDSRMMGRHRAGNSASEGYGVTPGQLGNLPENSQDPNRPTFWAASGSIVDNCYRALRPGGVAIWVLKSFVRKGVIIDFPGQWRQLCESVGFKWIHEHHAMLIKRGPDQMTLEGETVSQTKEYKTFFRRDLERKGKIPKIDYETVICMQK